MSPGIVVDVGNTAIKWGRCVAGRVVDTCSLPPESLNAWQDQAQHWKLAVPEVWVVTGVHPERRSHFEKFARRRGDRVHVLTNASSLTLRVRLEKPDHIGIDRLLDAVAANSRRRPDTPCVVIDAGSAVTVDWLDETGTFSGGAILPGPRLMATALHEHTALLPQIEPPHQIPTLPGTTTGQAMEAGIFWAVAGGVRALIEQYTASARTPPQVFLTGGDGALLHSVLGPTIQWWPTMTLEGIRLSAEALP